MNWLRKHPGFVGLLTIVAFAAIFYVVFSGHSSNKSQSQQSAPQSSSTSDNPIQLSNPSLSNTDMLTSLKNNPQYQNPLTGIAYDELFRNSDKYKGQFVHYTGKVIQVLGDPGNWNLRVEITQKGSSSYTYWEDPVLIFSYSPDRVIEKDLIDFTARANGVTTYKSVLGGEITIPSLTIYEQKVVGRAD